MSMSDDLKAIEAQVQEGLAKAENMDALEALRVGVLGRKGSLTAIMHTMGKVRSFYGNFLVVVKALAYLITLGKEGIPEASAGAVLNANYLMKQLAGAYDMSYDTQCMHEFVMTLQGLAHDTGVTAMDVAKRLLDFGCIRQRCTSP